MDDGDDGYVLLLLTADGRTAAASRYLPRPDYGQVLAFRDGREWARETGRSVALVYRRAELARWDSSGNQLSADRLYKAPWPATAPTSPAAPSFYHPTPDLPARLKPPSVFSPTAAWTIFRDRCRALLTSEPAAADWVSGTEDVLRWRRSCPEHLRWWNG